VVWNSSDSTYQKNAKEMITRSLARRFSRRITGNERENQHGRSSKKACEEATEIRSTDVIDSSSDDSMDDALDPKDDPNNTDLTTEERAEAFVKLWKASKLEHESSAEGSIDEEPEMFMSCPPPYFSKFNARVNESSEDEMDAIAAAVAGISTSDKAIDNPPVDQFFWAFIHECEPGETEDLGIVGETRGTSAPLFGGCAGNQNGDPGQHVASCWRPIERVDWTLPGSSTTFPFYVAKGRYVMNARQEILYSKGYSRSYGLKNGSLSEFAAQSTSGKIRLYAYAVRSSIFFCRYRCFTTCDTRELTRFDCIESHFMFLNQPSGLTHETGGELSLMEVDKSWLRVTKE
jgi:hypothetical protein